MPLPLILFFLGFFMKEKGLPKWLSHFIRIFFSSTESTTSKQVLPSCLEGKWSPSTGKTQPLTAHKQITSTASGTVQHAGIKASGSENTYCTFFQVAFGKWPTQKAQTNAYHPGMSSWERALLFAQEYPVISLSTYCGVITSDLTEQHPNGGISRMQQSFYCF